MSRMNINIDCSTGVIIEKPFTAEEETARDLLEASLDPDPPAYIAERKRAYSSIGDQLDMQYKDLLNGTTVWKDHVAKVKSDYPKP